MGEKMFLLTHSVSVAIFFPPLRFLLFFFIFHNINFSFFLWLWNFSLLTTLYTLSTRHNRLSCCDCAGWHLLDEGKRPRSLLFLAKKKERWRRAEIRTTTKKQVFPDFSTLRFAFLSNLLFYWIFLTSLICPDIARVFIISSNFSLFSFLIDSSSVSLHCQLKLLFHYTTHFTRFSSTCWIFLFVNSTANSRHLWIVSLRIHPFRSGEKRLTRAIFFAFLFFLTLYLYLPCVWGWMIWTSLYFLSGVADLARAASSTTQKTNLRLSFRPLLWRWWCSIQTTRPLVGKNYK